MVVDSSSASYILQSRESTNPRLTCTSKHAAQIRFVSESSISRAMEITVRRRGTRESWRWSVPPRRSGRPLTVAGPAGEYDIEIISAHFRRQTAKLNLSSRREHLSAVLQPLPVLSGTVATAWGLPLPGALVKTDVGSSAVANGNGRFELECDPDRWPKSITVSAAGFGDSFIKVPLPRTSSDLRTVTLAQAAEIAVEWSGVAPGAVAAVDLQILGDKGHSAGPVLQTLAPAGGGTKVIFDHVAPGEYLIVLSGKKPTERFAQLVKAVQGERAQMFARITPAQLSLRVSAAGLPLECNVWLRHSRLWQADVKVDETGEANVPVWQGGRLTALVESRGSVPFRAIRDVADGVDDSWSMELPANEVVGTVVDAQTHEPVPEAALSLEMISAEPTRSQLLVSTRAAADGTFRFAPVTPGQHTLKVAAPGYPVQEVSYAFGAAEETRSITLELNKSEVARLHVVDARRQPIAGARVLPFRAGVSQPRSMTGAGGEALVHVTDAETRTVFIVPRDGSFAVADLASGDDRTVAVADGHCQIEVQVESEVHEPLRNVSLLVRYGSYELPPEVLATFVELGSTTVSDASGRIVLRHLPAGEYDLWPITSPADVAAARDPRLRPPVHVVAVPGENRILLTFARRPQT